MLEKHPRAIFWKFATFGQDLAAQKTVGFCRASHNFVGTLIEMNVCRDLLRIAILAGWMIVSGAADIALAQPPQTPSQPLPTNQAIGVPSQLMSHSPPANTVPLRTPGFEVTSRIKDITTIEGHRSNQLIGVGLVMGLKGTGSKSPLTKQAAQNVLKNMGILADNIPVGSLSLVGVTAEVPAFVRVGEKINATVSSYDGATGLFGGQLVWTPLKGADGQTYAVATGPLRVNGFSAGGAAGGVSKNHDTTAEVQAQIELAIDPGQAFPENNFRLLLTNKDYTTAQRIASTINQSFPGHARALDPGSVHVYFPEQFRYSKLDFVAYIHNLRVVPDMTARVVINQKTGTIVLGNDVRLSSIMFASDNLIVTTSENPIASQPAPLSDGQTVVLPRSQVSVAETGGRYNSLNQNVTVGDLAAALNALGVSPKDLIDIFQGIQEAGALQATLIVK